MSNVIPVDFRANLGPGTLVDTQDRFALSSATWLSIQRYVATGSTLPVSDAAMRTTLKMDAAEPVDAFKLLIQAYADVKAHCEAWKNTTYPAVVATASDVVSYGSAAPTYYQEMLDLVPAMIGGDGGAKKKFMAILDNRAKEAQKHADKAAAAYDGIKRFAGDTAADANRLEALGKQYDKTHGATSDEARGLLQKIGDQMAVIAKETSEYEHSVIVAATTPTYVWVSPLGTIAAIVVAGVYGDRATKALARLRDATAEVERLKGLEQRSTRLLLQIGEAQRQLLTTRERLAAALPLLQQIQGAWNGLVADLKAIQGAIETDIRNAADIIKNVGIKSVLTKWGEAAKRADQFRNGAFITVERMAA